MVNFRILVNASKTGQVAIYLYGCISNPQDYGFPSFALGLAHDLIPDPTVRALVEKGDADAVEQMLLDKALIVPLIYY